MHCLIIGDGLVSCLGLSSLTEMPPRETCSWLPWFIHGFGHVIRYQMNLEYLNFVFHLYICLFCVCLWDRCAGHSMCGEVRGQLSGLSSPSTTGVLRNGCSNCSLQMRVLRQEALDQLAAYRTELHIGMEREARLGAANLESQC